MRISSSNTTVPLSTVHTASLETKAVRVNVPQNAVLETPARPLMTALVADFGNFGSPYRTNAGIDTSEFIDITKLKGHLPAADVAFLVAYDPETYNYQNTSLVPSLLTVLSAGQSNDTMEPITGGKLDQADFNNLVDKMPNRYQDTDRFALQQSDRDTRPDFVRVENIREVMRSILDTTDIEGTVLARPWENDSDFSISDRLEILAEAAQKRAEQQDEKKTLAEEYQELVAKREQERNYTQISAKPSQPKPVEPDVPSLEMLDPNEQALVKELAIRDQEVRAHELAHKAAGAGVTSAATFTYQQGPDGRQYAIGGEVQIQLLPGATPEDTMRRAKQVMSAATAPSNPSTADLRAASMASRMEQEARSEQAIAWNESRVEVLERGDQQVEDAAEMQSDPLKAGRLPQNVRRGRESQTQMAAVAALQEQFQNRDQRLDAPTELKLEREVARLTVAAPMGAYAEQFKLEEELDRRAFSSLELASEVAGIPTPQVVEARQGQADAYVQRLEQNQVRRSEVEVQAPRIDIQPSGSPDVEDQRFTLTQDVQQSKDDAVEEDLWMMVDPLEEKESTPKLQSFNGLKSSAPDPSSQITRSSEGLAATATDLDPVVSPGLTNTDPSDILAEAMKEAKGRFEAMLKSQQDFKKKQTAEPKTVSLQGNEHTIEIQKPDTRTLLQPERDVLRFSEQLTSNTSVLAQASLDTVGPTRLIPADSKEERFQLTGIQQQDVETMQAIKALEDIFAAS